eukprot:g77017.t1
MTFKKSELLYIILQRSRQQVARCQTSAPGIPATPTIIRLAPCFRLLQGARLLVLPTRDPSNPDNHSFGSVSSEVLNDGFLIVATYAGRAAGGVLQLQGGGRAEGRRGGRGLL